MKFLSLMAASFIFFSPVGTSAAYSSAPTISGAEWNRLRSLPGFGAAKSHCKGIVIMDEIGDQKLFEYEMKYCISGQLSSLPEPVQSPQRDDESEESGATT